MANVTAWIQRESGEEKGKEIARLELNPASTELGGINAGGTVGLWQGQWRAVDLQKGYYQVEITVTDRSGHSFSDRRSMRFSDPIAGQDIVGTSTYPDGELRRLDAALDLNGEVGLTSAVIDTTSGYAYFGTDTYPGRVIKIDLGEGWDPPERIGALILNSGENYLRCAVIDSDAASAYFGTKTSPGKVVKIHLGNGSDPPTRVDAITLNSGENHLTSAVIDPADGYAYFGTDTSPGKVVKIDLGNGSDPPARVGAITLDSGENHLTSAVIDPANGYAYFGTDRIRASR